MSSTTHDVIHTVRTLQRLCGRCGTSWWWEKTPPPPGKEKTRNTRSFQLHGSPFPGNVYFLGFYISSCCQGISYLRMCAAHQYKSKLLKPFLFQVSSQAQLDCKKWSSGHYGEARYTTVHTVGFYL